MKPHVRILVISPDDAYRHRVCHGLSQFSQKHDNPLGLTPWPCAPSEAMAAVLNPGDAPSEPDVQVALIDHLATEGADQAGASADRQSRSQAAMLALQLMAARPELSIYVLLRDDDDKLLIEDLASDAVDGYFFRDEFDASDWFRILSAEVAEKAETPFYDALRQYVARAKDSWHTPGHAGGASFQNSPWVGDFYDFVGEEMLRADLSVSVPELDSLLHPTGVIARAQVLAARAFGARRTYFATNGTSTSNKVIFQTLLTPGDTLLLDRNCHKSVHHGVILAGAKPVYLDSAVNHQYGLLGPVPRRTIEAAIAAHPNAKVMILTSCTYDGLRYNLKPLIECAHAAGIKVIVDEAWYGHARFHPQLRPTAMEAGADYATQSTHKVLSAFSQASMIHVNDPDFDAHLFRENFNMHASTSPQYNLIASLDVARKQAVMEGYRLLDRSLRLAHEVREKINASAGFKVLSLEDMLPEALRDDGILLDPTKLTIDISASGYQADELREVLINRFNIQIEKNTHNTITCLLTIGTTRSKVSRLFDALLRISKERRPPAHYVQPPQPPQFTQLACLPRDAFYESGEVVAILTDEGQLNPDLAGRVACDQITPYPPGIPVLVPGQVIDRNIVHFLARLLQTQKTIDVHGLVEGAGQWGLRVLTAQEAARLAARSGAVGEVGRFSNGANASGTPVSRL